jgi:hypothetical protein
MSKDKSINPASLPESEAFKNKEINQHKHLNDMGKPIDEDEKLNDDLKGKPANRTNKEEGLNEENSPGDAGAFEGFEDQGKD